MALIYQPDRAHLWFLGNIFSYVLILSPIFYYLKRHEDGRLVYWIRRAFSNPLGLLFVAACFIGEAMILTPHPYEMYAMTLHGYWLGLLAFLFGFCFVLSGEGFLKMIVRGRWVFLALATVLFVVRFTWLKVNSPYYLVVIESHCWIYALLAFGRRYLSFGGRALTYLSGAAYPVYILHMVFLYLGALLIFPLNMAVQLKFVIVLLITFAGCFITYELIRRLKWVRPLFGLKFNEDKRQPPNTDSPIPISSSSPGSSSLPLSSGNSPSSM
jgi:glucans biosynthesis protein C